MSNDPWYFQRWAREQKLGNPTRKLILTSLAITAESQTGAGFMAQGDLAEFAECSVRTVSDHLKALEAAQLLARRRRFSKAGRRIADGFLLLAPGIAEWPDGEPVDAAAAGSESPRADSAGGDLAQSPPEAQAAEQELPIERPMTDEKGARENRRSAPPPEFPEELRPHARTVMPILEAIAEQHNAKKVWPLTLGKTLMRFRRKPLVAVVHELDRWAVDPPRAIKDVVSTYATFLENKPDLQGVERLDEQGLPASGGGRSRNGSADPSVTFDRTRRRPKTDYDRVIQYGDSH